MLDLDPFILKSREKTAALLSLRGDLDPKACSFYWVNDNFILPSFGEVDIKTLAIKLISNMACLFYLAKISWKTPYYTTNAEVYSVFVNRIDKAKRNGQCLAT